MSRSADGATSELPFGPYRGRTVDDVAVMDPEYLARLVREGVGSPRVRADAARALAQLDRPRPEAQLGEIGLAKARAASLLSTVVRDRRAVIGACAVSALLVVAVADRRGGASPKADEMHRPASAVGAGHGDASASLGSLRGQEVGASGAGAGDGVAAAALSAADTGSTAARPAPSGPDAAASDTDSASAVPCGERTDGAVSAEVASGLVDTFQPVEFRVVKTKDTGRVTFLNSHDPYQGYFYVAIFPSDYDRYPDHPALYFRGRCIVVQGTIELYRGTPQIVLRGPDDVRIVGD